MYVRVYVRMCMYEISWHALPPSSSSPYSINPLQDKTRQDKKSF